jgi:DNA-binding CsgD family transcriptional regulator
VLQVNSTGTSSAGDPALLDQARALLEGSDRPSARALLARVHATRAVLGLADDPLALTSQAVALAREWGTDDDLAYCLRQRAEVMAADGDLLGCLDTLALGRDLAMHPSTRFYFLTTEMSVDNVLGRYTEAIRVGERALAATRASAGERVQASFVGANLIESYLLAGSPQAALDLAPRVVAQLPQRGWRAFVAWTLAGHHSWNDEDDLAADQFAAAGDGPPDDEAKTVLARVTAEHRLAEARDAATPQQRAASIEAAIAGLAPAAAAPRPREFFQLGPLVPVIARALAAAAESGTPVDPSLRERLAELRRDAPELPIARVWEALAAAELAEPAARPAAWRAAVDVLETTGPARYLHYARYRRAEALVAAGERDAAAAPLRLVASLAPGQGAGRVARWAGELAARAGVPLTAHPPQATGRGAVTGIDALTSRELQVLELVAEGLTNPQIGQRLFISPKTASVHVSAILAKIGATSRTEAAARFAGRSGRTAAGELADRSS